MHNRQNTNILICTILASILFSCTKEHTKIDATDNSAAPNNTYSLSISASASGRDVVKIDFLWVIDDTSSMCEEQKALSKSFAPFISGLREHLNVDIRMAVVTTDVIAEKGRGKFTTFRTNFPTPGEFYGQACAEKEVFKCAAHANCENEFGPGWRCHPPSQGMEYLANKNGSINSYCQFYCEEDTVCEDSFCGEEGACKQECLFESCVGQPDLDICPDELSDILTNDDMEYFKCNATVGVMSSNMETGLASAWLALDPDGPNKDQSARFLRDDAYLVIAFISDEDDCSIDEDFFSPSFLCSQDSDCPGLSKCLNVELDGEDKQLCQGAIKEDYYNMCGLLGEYRGRTHYNCAYDNSCNDCIHDEDCEDGWYCANGKKCRPQLYSFPPYATFQEPYGTPLYALAPVQKFHSKLRLLKADPAKVLVAVLTGDGIALADDENSLISDRCLGRDPSYPDEEAPASCKDYLDLEDQVPGKCRNDPTLPERCEDNALLLSRCEACTIDPSLCDGEGELGAQCEANHGLVQDCNAISSKMDLCHANLKVKRACIRQCYLQSKGDKTNPILAKSTYICSSELGQADYGNRYVQLANMFGPNGFVANICTESGIGVFLDGVAQLLIRRTTKICLPRPLEPDEQLTVIATSVNDRGETVSRTLKEGSQAGEYTLESPDLDCCFPDDQGECTGTLTALHFNEIFSTDMEILLNYTEPVPSQTSSEPDLQR